MTTLHLLIHLVLALLSLPLAAGCAYLLLLTLLSWPLRNPPKLARDLRFDIIVPAHNEIEVIERTVASLRRIDWPAYRILVIADNCSDNTAELARNAGATVLERFDSTLRGKGYAVRFGFEASQRDGLADAVLVIDADSEASPNILQACAARIQAGAQAVQVHYGVLNPDASARTRVMTLAYACIHTLRSRGRERLGLSCGIRGNGWCLTHDLLRKIEYKAFSLAEDVEFGIDLGLAGYRVHYAGDAEVLGEMVSGEAAARSQRTRWEGGRLALVRQRLPALLRAALNRPSAVCLDLAMDLLVPPLSNLVVGVAAVLVLDSVACLFSSAYLPWLLIGAVSFASVVLYVLRGLQLSGLGLHGLTDLMRAPAFVYWKLRLMLGSKRSDEWVRTQRERP